MPYATYADAQQAVYDAITNGDATAEEYDMDAIYDKAIVSIDDGYELVDEDTFWQIVAGHAYEVVEDNAGYIHISNGSEAWALGYDHTEDDARIAADIEAWRTGEWQPSEEEGQTRLTLAEFRDIADMTDSTRRSPITGAREA